MDFYLSSKLLKQIKEAGFEDDFELIIFDDIINCSKFSASFLSSKISNYIRNDQTINQFYVRFPDKSYLYSTIDELKLMIRNSNFINLLKYFLEGHPIHIDKTVKSENASKPNSLINKNESKDSVIAKLLIIFGRVLDNEEMINAGLDFFGGYDENTKITPENIFDLITYRQIKENNLKDNRLIEYIASNFYLLFKKRNDDNFRKLGQLTTFEVENILNSPKLQIEDEDSLFEIILSLGGDFTSLLDHVEIQYLSTKNIEILISLINANEISLHPLLWSSICRRLVLDPTKPTKMANPRQRRPITLCTNGIIKFLNEKLKENVYLAKEIDVEISKKDCGQIENLFDHSKNTHFRLANQKDSFIIFDFKEKKIRFSKYYFSVPTDKSTAYTGRPKSWKIEGSNDKDHWDLIDSRQNDSNLTSWGCSNTYVCQFNTNKGYRYIRIKDIVSQNSNQEFLLSEIEFFGSIV